MKKLTKLTALLLALIFVVTAFAGCNKGEQEQGPEFIYVPKYSEFPFEFSSIDRSAVHGDVVYVLAQNLLRTETVTEKDWDGSEYSYDREFYGYKIYSMKMDGSESRELPGFAYEQNSDYENGVYEYIRDFKVTEDGKIVILKMKNVTIFDLPADFDPATGNRYDYYKGNDVSAVVQILDSEGNTLEEKELYRVSGENADIYNMVYADNGCLYVSTSEKIVVIDADGKELYSMDNNDYAELMELPDGRVGSSSWGENGREFKILDNNAKGYGETINFPDNAYNIIGANEKYDIIYNDGSYLSGYDIETDTKEPFLSWLDADINGNDIRSAAVLENGDIFCLSTTWDNESGKENAELVTLVKTKAADVEQKKVITMATMWLDWDIRTKILEFNKTNPEYRIKVTEYSQYNTDEDYTLGLTKLNTEIISGKIPDIICTSSLPVNRYAAKGLLEDLTPYIDKTIGLDNIVAPFFDTLRDEDGKLYEIYSSFYVQTTLGLSKVVGDGSSWTFEDVAAALEKLPEGATVFDKYYTKESVLSNCIARNIDSFVNWETGECKFDTEEFINLLKFTDSFPKEYNWDVDEKWEDPATRIFSGKQMLTEIYIDSFNRFRGETFYTYGKDISFVGYPTIEGSGSSFSANGGYAMSAKSEYKDVIWDFISVIMSEEYQNEHYWNGIPTNKIVFDKMMEEAKTPNFTEYAKEEYESMMNGGMGGGIIYDDGFVSATPRAETEETPEAEAPAGEENKTVLPENEFGKPQINEDGWYEAPKDWAWSPATSNSIPVYAMTDYEYETIMGLINGTTSFSRYDQSIMEVISEEAQAYFEGQKSAEETAKMIQSRVKLYVNEQR